MDDSLEVPEVEVAEGVFKRPADCDASEVEGFEQVSLEKREIVAEMTGLMSAVGAGLKATGRRSIPAEFAELFAQAARVDPVETPLSEWKAMLVELEALAPAVFDTE